MLVCFLNRDLRYSEADLVPLEDDDDDACGSHVNGHASGDGNNEHEYRRILRERVGATREQDELKQAREETSSTDVSNNSNSENTHKYSLSVPSSRFQYMPTKVSATVNTSSVSATELVNKACLIGENQSGGKRLPVESRAYLLIESLKDKIREQVKRANVRYYPFCLSTF